MNSARRVPKHLEPGAVKLSIFTSNDIKKLSVQRIITPLTLDAMGHPVPGGLYDKILGPCTDRGEPCGTCYENIFTCPGHFSFIELPIPVVNPIFHKVIGMVLKFSCLECFRIQLQDDNRIRALSESSQAHEIQLDFIKLVMEEVKTGRFCIFCKKLLKRIQVLKNRILLITKKEKSEPGTPSAALKSSESQFINPMQSKNYLRKIWENESEIVKLMAPILNSIELEHPTDAFFMEAIPVPPPNVRPLNVVRGRGIEHSQTNAYKNLVANSLAMNHLISVVQKKGDVNALASKEAKDYYASAKGNTAIEKLNNCWEDLQNNINDLLNKESANLKDGIGLKQIIEKKTGIIRQHMMGKRVNFAARSVITPDPNLDIGEVGIPEVFAKKLTYPVPVTPWNVEYLRTLISNGPDVYPGAVAVEMEDGLQRRINPGNQAQQESLLKVLLTPHSQGKRGFQGVKVVHRHLQNGDILLLNRQPTLHKPSIMAHRARILKGEKTLRMHYANCKAYNADFDGDEMNAHLPQDEVARSEGYNIAEVAQQYLVPKDGTPLSGLIQDHMIAGVRLSLRGSFFNKADYEQLVFQALSHKVDRIKTLPPYIIKPIPLWSGKQVLSTVIINVIPKDQEPINLNATSKIPAKAWKTSKPREWVCGGTPFKDERTMSEAEVVIRHGELLSGILDKTHYGATAYGLVHCMYELYGGSCALQLLSSFTKVFTRFLQQDGFTLGVRDILTTQSADRKRKKCILNLRQIGQSVMASALGLPEDTPVDDLVSARDAMIANDSKFQQVIDRQYKMALDQYTNQINNVCLPAGLVTKFPQNNLQLMVQSGAKGSTVNTMQISCLLGQIELEGKRPPVMISGTSMPSFPATEFAPRSGGFIDARFMTGLQPQEFFFHCMAGREGLIDTAVKTSRSGYLQRCLIKHLEGLRVGYDLTVRNSDQSVIQFLYGEDGMDISKAQFLNKNQLPFLKDNAKSIVKKDVVKNLKREIAGQEIDSHREKIRDWLRDKGGDAFKRKRISPFSLFVEDLYEKSEHKMKLPNSELYKTWQAFKPYLKQRLSEACKSCPDPVTSLYQPDHYFGSLNEHVERLGYEFSKNESKKVRKQFDVMLKVKSMQSLCPPGEPVGLLAAQSIGEPSTQMTLNTFHFAGRGDMNVTLGIPRLREILMMASKNIKTPSMEIPFLNVSDVEAKAQVLKTKLTRVVVADILEDIRVSVRLELLPRRQQHYTLRFNFLPKECCKDYYAPIGLVLKHMKSSFFHDMFLAIDKMSKIKSRLITYEEQKAKSARARTNDDDDIGETTNQQRDENSSDDEVEDEDDAKMSHKQREANEDQDPDDDDEKRDAESGDEDVANADDSQAQEKNNEKQDDYVLGKYIFANKYSQNKKRRWCELSFALPLRYKRCDLTNLLKDVAVKSVLWQTPHIKRAITYVKDGALTLRTDGINVVEMFKYHDLLDLNKLYCNDIHKMAETYGIEAASKILVKEVKDVFNVYGIKVDARHLSLIADYMTFTGHYEPMSRKGIEKSASPLQQMSFESSLAFLKEAIIKAKQDDLSNPSSSLILGKPCEIGTGSFHLLSTLPK